MVTPDQTEEPAEEPLEGLDGAPLEEPRPPSPWPLRLAHTYLVGIILVWMLSRGLAERVWWSTILLYIPQVVYLAPLALTLPFALFGKDGKALAVNVGAALLAAWVLMGFNIPLPKFPPPAQAPRVRVLAYNIKGGLEGFDALTAQVERFRPDVVVFSEALGWKDDAATRKFMARQFAGWNSLYAQEVFIASRWPFVDEEAQPLGPAQMKYQGPQRKAGRVSIQAPFGRFQVMGAHFYTSMHGWTLRKERRRLPAYLKNTAEARRLQAQQLLDWTKDTTDPIILAGDFNTPPTGMIYRSLADRFRDAFREKGWGWGYTYPSDRPLLRIDYIFHSRHWSTTQCEVGPAPGSDHRPVFAELAFTP